MKTLIGKDRMKIKIKYHADIKPIEKISKGDWIDLRAAEDVSLKKDEMKYISLGVSMQLPVNHEAIVAARSSTPEKFGVVCANSIGVIDNSYCGNNDVWKFPALAIRDTQIHKGDRICQFRIIENQPVIEFETVVDLGGPDRGGFGSTGRN